MARQTSALLMYTAAIFASSLSLSRHVQKTAHPLAFSFLSRSKSLGARARLIFTRSCALSSLISVSFQTTPGLAPAVVRRHSTSGERPTIARTPIVSAHRAQATRASIWRAVAVRASGRKQFRGTKTTLSQAWSGNRIRGPQCAFEMSMFMCPAVHKLTRN